MSATPPREQGAFRSSDLVELSKLDPAIHLDIRYATKNDFLGTPVYTQARAFLQRPAAEALVRALHKLQPLGYGLLIHDAYRPWYVTKIFWDATPPEGKIFVADPAQGSRHNRGCAVDLTLYDLKTGQPIEMTGGYDEMSPRSFPELSRRHFPPALAPRSSSPRHGVRRFHCLRIRVVAFRLQGLARIRHLSTFRSKN